MTRSIDDIIGDLFSGEILSPSDEILLKEWMDESESNRQYFNELTQLRNSAVRGKEHLLKDRFEEIINAGQRKTYRRSRLRYSAIAAAAIIFVVSLSVVVIHSLKEPTVELSANDIFHTSPEIILTLSDGKTMRIGNGNEQLILKDGAVEMVAGEGGLKYDGSSQTGITAYNTLTIPRGGIFELNLSDGTKVYLNSGSEIRYPVSFSGDSREIYLSGEAYFDVRSDEKNPFIAHVGDLDIIVTGTQFNIKAYPGQDNIATTLVEGAVRVTDGNEGCNLTPGTQAVYNRANNSTEVIPVRTEHFTAWKDGYFHFSRMPLEDVMEVLSMWYDFDVVYSDDSLRKMRFGGRFLKSNNLSYLLGKFSETNTIIFDIDGKKVTVREK